MPVGSWLRLTLLVTLSIVVFEWLGVPSAPMFGGLLGGVAHALSSTTPLVFPPWSFRLGQGIIGASTGATIEWASLAGLGSTWPWVLIVVVATLVASIAVGQLLRLNRGVDVSTATFSSVAGGASGMTALARDFGADERIVTVNQYLRVLVILVSLPFVVSFFFGATGTGPLPVAAAGTSWSAVGFAAIAVAAGLLVGRALHLPSPAVLGCMLAAALLGALPWFEDLPVPASVQAVGFVLIGVQVGLRFTRSTLASIGRMLPISLVIIALVIGICAGLGVVLSEVTGVSRSDGYLATTPGGLPAVLAATSSTDGDLTFVSAVQVLRILIVLILTPVVARLVVGRRRGDA